MKSASLLVMGALVLAGCGRAPVERYNGGIATSFSSGHVSDGCLKGGRSAANRQLCGCLQSVADRRLTQADQRLAHSFFSDPQRAHEVRHSDYDGHEAFWDRYKGFSQDANARCKGL